MRVLGVGSSAMAQFSKDDEGKDVVVGDEKVGMIQEVEGSMAHVNPDAGVSDRIRASLDWGDGHQDTYPLKDEMVDTITDDEVRLRDQM